MPKFRVKTSVLIVGAGPVGITLQLLLSKYGIPCLLAEKHVKSRCHPRAHFLSNRSMEVWRQLGDLDSVLEALVEPLYHWRYLKYCRHVIDPQVNLFGVNDYFRDHHKYSETYFEPLSPCRIANLGQHKFLFLLKAVAFQRSINSSMGKSELFRRWFRNELKFVLNGGSLEPSQVDRLAQLSPPLLVGNRQPLGCQNRGKLVDRQPIGCQFQDNRDINNHSTPSNPEQQGSKRTEENSSESSKKRNEENSLTHLPFIDGGLRFERVVSEDDFITSHLTCLRTGKLVEVQSGFLIGSDGIHSKVRQHINPSGTGYSSESGTNDLRDVVSVYFSSDQLGEIVRGNSAMLYFVFSEHVCVLVTQGGNPAEFMLQLPTFPQLHPEPTHLACEQIIQEAVGIDLPDLTIKQVKKWTVSTGLADQFARNKIAIAGDAAHLVAPAGGLGMNMGVADAYNLAWRIARFVYDRLLADRGGIGGGIGLREFVRASGGGSGCLEGYGRERRGVAEYLRLVCLTEIANGSKFAKSLLYNHSLAQQLLDRLPNFSILRKGANFLLQAVQKMLKHRYSTPKALESVRKIYANLISANGFLGLAFPGADLAYAYCQPTQGRQDLKIPTCHRAYTPTALVGRRIPHCHLYTTYGHEIYRISTVDLPSLMQPAIFYCLLVFKEDLANRVREAIRDLRFAFVALWEDNTSADQDRIWGYQDNNQQLANKLALQDRVTISDNLLSQPIRVVNACGLMGKRLEPEQPSSQVHFFHQTFSTTESDTDISSQSDTEIGDDIANESDSNVTNESDTKIDGSITSQFHVPTELIENLRESIEGKTGIKRLFSSERVLKEYVVKTFEREDYEDLVIALRPDGHILDCHVDDGVGLQEYVERLRCKI